MGDNHVARGIEGLGTGISPTFVHLAMAQTNCRQRVDGGVEHNTGARRLDLAVVERRPRDGAARGIATNRGCRKATSLGLSTD